MLLEKEKEFLCKFEKWLDSNLLFKEDLSDTHENKIDFLERIIEVVRYFKEYSRNKMDLEKLKDYEYDFLENGKIRILPGSNKYFNKLSQQPRKSIELQIPLLIFLLVYDKKDRSVLHIIENFINEFRYYLHPRDYERTRTGAKRCFTNTRFAARELRNYGLLKFSQKEAYKTWELSFLGLLVASILYDSDWQNRLSKMPLPFNDYKNIPKKLVKGLWRVFDILCDPVALEMSLRIIDKKNKPRIKHSKKELNDLLSLIRRYHKSIFIETNNQKDKATYAWIILEQIEKIPSIEKFMREYKLNYEMKEFTRLMSLYLRI